MLIQALLLVAVIVLISGSIMTSTIVTAKTAFSHSVMSESHAAMSDATADFIAWAQNRVKTSTSHTSWAPRLIDGKSDTSEFYQLCIPERTLKLASVGCKHAEKLSWAVTGRTDDISSSISNYVLDSPAARNMSRPVDEQHISAIISTDIDSADGKLTFASLSRKVTARVFDAAPFVIVTGIQDIATANGPIKAEQGDSAGQVGRVGQNRSQQTPNPGNPASLANTRITTTIDCRNSPDVIPSDPLSGQATGLIDEGRDGDMDWKYESTCVPKFQTPPPPPDLHYLPPNGTTYATVDGDRSNRWLLHRPADSRFPN